MKVVGVAELKATLSSQLASVRAGEDVVVTDRGKPIARITAMPKLELTERLESLARQGIIKLPRCVPSEQEPKLEDPDGRLLTALLAEREEGR